MGPSATVTARAGANIALVKYWGKRDAALNLPAAGSLSLTLAELSTTTSVRFDPGLDADRLSLDGKSEDAARLSRWLDLVRARAGISQRAAVESSNNFPTASGLASSASAYAALALAATRAAGLELPAGELSVLARRGSGSAARSIFAGLVEMRAGSKADGSDAVAEPIDSCDSWPLRLVVAVVGAGARKKHGSTDAMEHCKNTSPLHEAWLASVPGDLIDARRAIARRDFELLGQVTERSACAMHGSALAARPAIRYLEPATVACLNAVVALRESGTPAYFTMDAGPHVKVLTLEDCSTRVASELEAVAGVSRVIVARPGPGAKVI